MESVVYAKPYAGMALSTALCTAECWDWLVCLGIDFWWAIFSSACCVRVSLYTENPSTLAVSRPTCWIQAPPRCQHWQPAPWGHACRYPWSAAGVSQLAIFLLPVLHREGPCGYGCPPYGKHGPASTGLSTVHMEVVPALSNTVLLGTLSLHLPRKFLRQHIRNNLIFFLEWSAVYNSPL